MITVKKLPPKKSTGIQVAKIRLPKIKSDIEQIQQFFPSHSENSLTVQFKTCSFGIRIENGKATSFMRNNEAKDNDNILQICKVIKQQFISGATFEEIENKLMSGQYANSIKIFLNILNKPVETSIPA